MVLAGGRGRRLGGINKSLIEIEGLTILQRTLDVLKPLFNEILISGWTDKSELPAGIRMVDDNFPGRGPLAGIEAAMKATQAHYIFVFGGDMPWLSETIIRDQAVDFLEDPVDVLVPRINNFAEPLHAIYNCRLQSSLETFLRSGERPAVIDFIRLSRVRYLDLPSTEETVRAFTNINTSEDLQG